MKIINLKFSGDLTRIAGNPFGRSIYKEQVEKYVDWKDINKIIFPDTINGVSISFVQGLIANPVEVLGGINEFEKHFILSSPIEKVETKLQNSLRF